MFSLSYRFCFLIGFTAIIFLSLSAHCLALSPDELLIVVNKNSTAGIRLAEYYMRKRGIPEKNLVVLDLPIKEVCSREAYEMKIAAPVRKHLKEATPKYLIRCLVLMYGLPLKAAPPISTDEDKKNLIKLKEKQRQAKAQLKALSHTGSEKPKSIKNHLQGLNRKISMLEKSDQWASVDSELSLVLKEDYPLPGWQSNPLYMANKDKKIFLDKLIVLMVSRLDGPSERVVKRIIDDSLYAEENGLSGMAYFDARWPESVPKPESTYAHYDRSIHRTADLVKADRRFTVVKEETDQLFQPGQGLKAALYCGWYSLGQYVDAFTWQPGSIGYHIASSECATLKKKDSRVWCKMMLEKGVAATLGPVNEPYIQAFPLPEVFFGILLEGSYTLVETYYLSLPHLSWKMVLIGDPLYKPFR